jgi:SpoVK/Ycf46/Vps4 family AAA+-type ATPase
MPIKTTYQTPILSDELSNKISDAIQAFLNRGKWKQFGLDKIREQGAAILFFGSPGTGKTITAYYVAKKLHLGVREVSMADYGSHVPGELARNIEKIFKGEAILAKQENRQLPIIFLDECDSMLISRKKLGHDMIWMLEPITALLTAIAKYQGLVLLSTNMAPFLDEALERRLIAKVEFTRPTEDLRRKMWRSKWPVKFPTQPTEKELIELAKFDLSGAQIENVFLLWCGQCFRKDKGETFKVSELITFIRESWKGYFES